jgi:hypothetical protein
MPTTWNVPAQGDLQTVINNAGYGDTIIVASSYSFTGPLLLPNKGTPPNPAGSNANFLTIQTSGLASLPATNNTFPSIVSNPPFVGRVNPSHAPFMPKVLAPAGTSSEALNVASGAQYYRFVGIEFSAADGGLSQNDPTVSPKRYYCLRCDGTSGGTTGDVANGIPNAFSQLPGFIQFDRCYIHSFVNNKTFLHGVLLYTLVADICNCYVSGFNGQSGDSQAIQLAGPGQYNVINNYAEASTENIFFGRGSFAYSAANNGIPPGAGASGTAQTLVKYNSCIKSDAWRVTSGASFVQPFETANYFCKNLFEVKVGKNITFDHNYLKFSFDEFDQHGIGMGINLINYSGWEFVENITFTNNVIDSVCGGLYFAWTIEGNPAPTSGTTIKNITFRNNLIVNFCLDKCFGNLYPNSAGQNHFSGEGKVFEFAMVGATAAQNIIIDHNSFITAGAPVSVGTVTTQEGSPSHAQIVEAFQSGATASASTGINGFQFTNNILPNQAYGFIWAPNGYSGGQNANDFASWRTFAPAGVMGGNLAYGNPISGAAQSPSTATFFSNYDPAHTNFTPTDLPSVGLLSGVAQQLNFGGQGIGTNGTSIVVQGYTLPTTGSQYNGTGTDGLNPGCDITQLAWTTASGPTPTATSINNNTGITISQGSNAVVNVQVTATGSTPTGAVTLILNPGGSQQTFGPLNLTNGQVTFQPPTFSTASLTPGSYTLAANYAGVTGQFAASSGSTTLTVTGALPRAVVGITPTTVTYPNNSPITVQISAPSGQTAIPTGTVNILVDGVQIPGQLPLSPNGFAYFILNLGNAGNHAIIAMYSGDTNYASATGTATATVNPASDTMTVQMPSVINQGQNATVVVTLTSP